MTEDEMIPVALTAKFSRDHLETWEWRDKVKMAFVEMIDRLPEPPGLVIPPRPSGPIRKFVRTDAGPRVITERRAGFSQ